MPVVAGLAAALTGCASFYKVPEYFQKPAVVALVSMHGNRYLHLTVNQWEAVSDKHAGLNSVLEKDAARQLLSRVSQWPSFHLLPVQKIINTNAYQMIPDDFEKGHRRRSFQRGLKKFDFINAARAEKLHAALGARTFLILWIGVTLHIKQIKGNQYCTPELKIRLEAFDTAGRLIWRDSDHQKAADHFLMEGALDFNVNPMKNKMTDIVIHIEKRLRARFFAETGSSQDRAGIAPLLDVQCAAAGLKKKGPYFP